MNYNPQKHHRRSIRLKNYDYSQAGSYFLTLCVQNRRHLFGEIRNGIMGLNQFGSIAYEEWIKTLEIRKNISLGAMIIMPNHMHGIIHIDYSIQKNESIGKFQSPSQTIGAIIRGYKGATTKRIKAILRSTGELPFASTEEEFASTEEEFASTEEEFASTEEEFASTEEGFASTSTDGIDLNKSIWQRNYYEHIIKNKTAYENITNYIEKNPLNWQKDTFSN